MRGTITILGISLIAAGTARGQATPSTSRAANPPPSASAPAPARAGGAAARPRVYASRPRNVRPAATGLDGLDIPIDRRTYGGPPGPGVASRVEDAEGRLVSATGAALSPPGAPTSGSRYLINSGAIEAYNPPGGWTGQSVYTFTNNQGGTSAVLYDPGSGGATRYDYIGSVGHVYYGDLPAGTPRFTPQVPTLTYGNGNNSLSGPGQSFSADSVGPFGAAHFPAPAMPSINPISPSITGGVYGISPGLQAPSMVGTPSLP